MARSVMEAVKNALEFCRRPYWKGPLPTPDGEFRVDLVGDGKRWIVRGGRVHA